MKVRIGVAAWTQPSALIDLVDRCAEHEIDSLWFSDQRSGEVADPIVGMAAALGRTPSLKVGAGVLVLPGRDPVMIARQLAGLAAIAPGRVLPAFGLGVVPAGDRPADGAPLGEALEESMAILRALLTNPRPSFPGRHLDVEPVRIAPLPDPPLDLWLAGTATRALHRVGRLGDGWLGSLLSPSQAESAVQTISHAAGEAGRSIDDEHYGMSLLIGQDGIAPGIADRLRAGTDIRDVVPGTWSAAADLIRRYVDAGVSKFVIRPADRGTKPQTFLEGFGRHLKPLERELSA